MAIKINGSTVIDDSQNFTSTGTISATGNITGGNILGTVVGTVSTPTVSASGNVTGGNILTGGVVSATGNVTGNYLLGNAYFVTGLSPTQIYNGTSNVKIASADGNATVSINGTPNVAVYATTGEYVTGLVSATGTITGGNLATGGTASATGTVTGGNLATGGTASASGNITGGNLATGGTVSATGNIHTGANLLADGYITVGNGLMSTSTYNGPYIDGIIVDYPLGNGRITLGADDGFVINTNGLVTPSPILIIGANGTLTANNTINGGNVNTSGNISATGTITGASVIGGVITGTSVSVTGAVTAASTVGGIITGSSASVSGTVTGGSGSFGNVTGTNFSGTSASVSGGVTAASVAGGVITGTSASVTGNVTGASLIGTIATASQPTITAVGTLSTLNVSGNITADGMTLPGNATIGNLYVSGVTTIAGNIQQISGNSGQFFGNATTGFNALYAGLPAGFSILPNSVVNFVSTSNSYSQINTQNQNGGSESTGDLVITGNNGDDSNYYLDLGYAGSGYDGTVAILDNALGNSVGPNDGYIYVHGNTAGNVPSDFVIATPDSNAQVRFAVGGSMSANVAVKVNAPNTDATTGTTGTLNVLGGVGVNGNIYAAGNITVSGNHSLNGQLSATGNIIGNSKLLIGTGVSTLINPVAVFTGNGTDYAQLAMNNPTSTGSSDLATYGNNGDDSQSWMDMGFTGNAFSDSNYTITSAGDGYLFAQGNTSFGGNLVVATGNTGTTRDVVFSFGFLSSNEFLRFQRSTNTILPYANTTANIGSSTRWINNLYSSNHYATIVSATGTITGGNLATGGTISSTGNITGGNISATNHTGGNVSVTGTVTGGNLVSGGTISANGNVTAGNLSGTTVTAVSTVGGIITGSSVSVTGTVTAASTVGGVITGSTASLSGTVTGGNLATAGTITGASVSVTGTVTGASGNFGTGTITGGNIVNGNGNGVGNIGSSSTYFNTVFAKATSAQYADLAEKYTADAEYAPGTVLVFGGSAEVTVNAEDGDRRVAGVVSTNPSYIMNGGLEADHVATVALTGRVPTFVLGPVKKGDMMVAAGLGRARSDSDPKVGTVIGKALEDFDGAEGTIEVVVGRF